MLMLLQVLDPLLHMKLRRFKTRAIQPKLILGVLRIMLACFFGGCEVAIAARHNTRLLCQPTSGLHQTSRQQKYHEGQTYQNRRWFPFLELEEFHDSLLPLPSNFEPAGSRDQNVAFGVEPHDVGAQGPNAARCPVAQEQRQSSIEVVECSQGIDKSFARQIPAALLQPLCEQFGRRECGKRSRGMHGLYLV